MPPLRIGQSSHIGHEALWHCCTGVAVGQEQAVVTHCPLQHRHPSCCTAWQLGGRWLVVLQVCVAHRMPPNGGGGCFPPLKTKEGGTLQWTVQGLNWCFLKQLLAGALKQGEVHSEERGMWIKQQALTFVFSPWGYGLQGRESEQPQQKGGIVTTLSESQ